MINRRRFVSTASPLFAAIASSFGPVLEALAATGTEALNPFPKNRESGELELWRGGSRYI